MHCSNYEEVVIAAARGKMAAASGAVRELVEQVNNLAEALGREARQRRALQRECNLHTEVMGKSYDGQRWLELWDRKVLPDEVDEDPLTDDALVHTPHEAHPVGAHEAARRMARDLTVLAAKALQANPISLGAYAHAGRDSVEDWIDLYPEHVVHTLRAFLQAHMPAPRIPPAPKVPEELKLNVEAFMRPEPGTVPGTPDARTFAGDVKKLRDNVDAMRFEMAEHGILGRAVERLASVAAKLWTWAT